MWLPFKKEKVTSSGRFTVWKQENVKSTNVFFMFIIIGLASL